MSDIELCKEFLKYHYGDRDYKIRDNHNGTYCPNPSGYIWDSTTLKQPFIAIGVSLSSAIHNAKTEIIRQLGDVNVDKIVSRCDSTYFKGREFIFS